ncbi:MAG: Nif3-like dinuclear metal center hexameric protein, partial [Clostridiaceae bacterium]|nr:Nif3-like dinuclear metal center hexameric protein [Clostridiaceae bacterium]
MGTVKCQTVAGILDELAPRRLAESWDNVGLLVGDGKQNINRLMVCLDVPEWVVEEAIEKNVDMIISHHPMIFNGIKRINSDTATGRKLLSLIKNNIALYSMHTNYDIVAGGLNDIFARELGFYNSSVIVETYNEGQVMGLGRIAELEKETTLSIYANDVKTLLGADHITFAGDPNRAIKKVALLNGSGNKFVNDARFAGADVLVTGDMQYHGILDALEMGLCVIDAGHYATEKIMIKYIT